VWLCLPRFQSNLRLAFHFTGCPLNPYNNEYRTVVASSADLAISYYLAAKTSLSLRFSGSTKAVLGLQRRPGCGATLTPVAAVDCICCGGSGAPAGALGVSHRLIWIAISDRPQHSDGGCGVILKRMGTSLFTFDHLDDDAGLSGRRFWCQDWRHLGW